MSEEKSFCELLAEQRVDEEKAVKIYERLLDLLEKEKDMLQLTDETLNRAYDGIIAIKFDQEHHAELLKRIRKTLCQVK